MENNEIRELLKKVLREKKGHRLNPLTWIRWIFSIASIVGGPAIIVVLVVVLLSAAAAIPSMILNFAYAWDNWKASRTFEQMAGDAKTFKESLATAESELKKAKQENENLGAQVALRRGLTPEEYMKIFDKLGKKQPLAVQMAMRGELTKESAEDLRKYLLKTSDEVTDVKGILERTRLDLFNERTSMLWCAFGSFSFFVQSQSRQYQDARGAFKDMVRLLELFAGYDATDTGWDTVAPGRTVTNRVYFQGLISDLVGVKNWFFTASSLDAALTKIGFTEEERHQYLSRICGTGNNPDLEARLKERGLWPR